jgi:hypothetical protein
LYDSYNREIKREYEISIGLNVCIPMTLFFMNLDQEDEDLGAVFEDPH